MNAAPGPATLKPLPACLVAFALCLSPSVEACPVEAVQARIGADSAQAQEADAAHAARSPELLGAASAFATAQAARQVMSLGRDWQFTVQLAENPEEVPDDVATPYRVQANGGPELLATELLEALVLGGHAGATLSLAGRMMKQPDGGQLVVLTSWRVINP